MFCLVFYFFPSSFSKVSLLFPAFALQIGKKASLKYSIIIYFLSLRGSLLENPSQVYKQGAVLLLGLFHLSHFVLYFKFSFPKFWICRQKN